MANSKTCGVRCGKLMNLPNSACLPPYTTPLTVTEPPSGCHDITVVQTSRTAGRGFAQQSRMIGCRVGCHENRAVGTKQCGLPILSPKERNLSCCRMQSTAQRVLLSAVPCT